jgi:hypothetical protein
MHYFFWFWTRVVQLAIYIVRTRKKETAKAYRLLDGLERRFGGHFQPATRYKIAVSHGIYNPMICDAFARLRGRNTQAEEQDRLIHYFTCSSLFDDFTDLGTLSEAQMQAISFTPEAYAAHTFDEKVFRYAHIHLKELVQDPAAYMEVARSLFAAQIRSKQQANSTLPDADIEAVTFDKGGNSVLLCSYYLDFAATPAEQACWYTIGTLIQLTNDLYDIHKDLQDHIDTLPVRMRSIQVFEQYFLGRIAEMKRCISALPFDLQVKQEFSLRMAGIYSFGLIAIAQLKRWADAQGNLPDFRTLHRKQLVVDMEKPANLARWFRFTYRFAKL